MPKYTVKLTRVDSIHNNLRDEAVYGWTNDLPEYGSVFQMFAAPRDNPEANVRLITTSNVQEVIGQDDKTIVFSTRNSTYKVEVLP